MFTNKLDVMTISLQSAMMAFLVWVVYVVGYYIADQTMSKSLEDNLKLGYPVMQQVIFTAMKMLPSFAVSLLLLRRS